MVQLHERQWRVRPGEVWRNDGLVQLVEARDCMRVVVEAQIERRARLASVDLDVTFELVSMVVTGNEVSDLPVRITPHPPFPHRLYSVRWRRPGSPPGMPSSIAA